MIRKSQAIDSHSTSSAEIPKDKDIFCLNKEREQLCMFNSNFLSFLQCLSAATSTWEIHPNRILWSLPCQQAIEPLTFLSRSLRAQGMYFWSVFSCCGGVGALRSGGEQHPTLNPKVASIALFQLEALLEIPALCWNCTALSTLSLLHYSNTTRLKIHSLSLPHAGEKHRTS